jgi:hypothetical protein
VRLLVFQYGHSRFYELAEEDDWIVLIPVIVSGSSEARIHDGTTEQQITVKLEPNMEMIITGRCSMWLATANSACVCGIVSWNRK